MMNLLIWKDQLSELYYKITYKKVTRIYKYPQYSWLH
jgi:hypothetical protein